MKKIKNGIEQQILSEEISLPESLSAENIEKLINEKGSILEPKMIYPDRAKNIIKWCASAAACFVAVIAALMIFNNASIPARTDKQDGYISSLLGNSVQPATQNGNENNGENQPDTPANPSVNNIASDDYSKIEAAALKYYQKLYNESKPTFTEQIKDSFVDLFDGSIGLMPGDDNAASEGFAGSTSSSNGSTYGETNTQVKGVDEGDIIKNDGKHIFYLSDSKIIISDCSNPKNMQVVATIKCDGKNMADSYRVEPDEIYVNGNLLAVIYSKYIQVADSADVAANGLCDCLYPTSTNTLAEIYDISDVAKPKLLNSFEFDGDYLSSRITDEKLIIITNYTFPYYELINEEFETACDYIKENCVPTYSIDGADGTRVDANNITVVDEENPTSYIVTALVDLTNIKSKPLTSTIIGSGYETYCTKDNLYITTSEYAYYYPAGESKKYIEASDGKKFTGATTIHKFSITDDGIKNCGSATVGGSMVNQFAMDEFEGVLRVATNGNEYIKDDYFADMQNMVYTLDENMKIIGFLGGIATGENMKSARFLNNMLYFVTFVQTDPLFAIDLSDAANPKVLGELKIPGFSTYLHPVSENLLIGIGEGGNAGGVNGYAKVSLFDISDPANLRELDNYTTDSPGFFKNSHKPFVMVDDDTFVLPFVYNTANRAELLVFTVANNSIRMDARINFISGTYNRTEARGTYIGSTLYAVNNLGIIAYDMHGFDVIGRLEYD